MQVCYKRVAFLGQSCHTDLLLARLMGQ